MEVQRATRYPLHGRAQVALPSQTIVAGHTVDISEGGVCLLLNDRISVPAPCTIRFEMCIKGQVHIITAQVKSVYGVFASQGGFRAGFEFKDSDQNRTALIKSLAGKKPMVESASIKTAAPILGSDFLA